MQGLKHNGWDVWIGDRFSRSNGYIPITICKFTGMKMFQLMFHPDGHAEMVERQETDEYIPPSMSLHMHDYEGILAAFQEALSGKNIKTVDDNLLKGKLEAVNDHLQDMRRLVFTEDRVEHGGMTALEIRGIGRKDGDM